jgi:hypothetical protein
MYKTEFGCISIPHCLFLKLCYEIIYKRTHEMAKSNREDDINLINRTHLVHNFFKCIYCFSVHVSGNYVPITRRKHCTYGTPRICHSIWVTLWYAWRNFFPPCIPESHLYTVTNTRCRIGTVIFSDDGHRVARNM